MVEIGHHRCYSLHTQSSKVRTGLRLCSFSTMPKLVVYKGYSGHVRQYMCYFFTYTIIGVSVGPAHVLNPDHAFTGCVQRISYRSRWASRVLSLHIQSLRVWSGLLLCTISIMPSLVVYKRILYRSGWASQVLFITYTIIEGQVGVGLCSILAMPSLVVYKGYRASRVLFFIYTIVKGFIEPEHMRNRISLIGHH